MSELPGTFPDTIAWSGPYQSSAALPLGEWSVMANGRIYKLTIKGIKGADVDATLTSGDLKDARWDAAGGHLTFTRVIPGVVEQAWEAYLFAHDAADPLWRMAGSLRATRSLSGGSVPMNPGGWYATLPR